MYRLYRVNVVDDADLIATFNDDKYDECKLLRDICYTADEKDRESGESKDFYRYIIISD